MILLGGRQGLIADITDAVGWGRFTFAYGLLGLFLAYLYFSLPRAIITRKRDAPSDRAASSSCLSMAAAAAV